MVVHPRDREEEAGSDQAPWRRLSARAGEGAGPPRAGRCRADPALVLARGRLSSAGRRILPRPSPVTQPRPVRMCRCWRCRATWESSADDDPHNPHANPRSLIGYVTRPLQQQFPEFAGRRVHGCLCGAVLESAWRSRRMGRPPTTSAEPGASSARPHELADMVAHLPAHQLCPDGLLPRRGHRRRRRRADRRGQRPDRPDQVLGVTLIADGRREADQGMPVGRTRQRRRRGSGLARTAFHGHHHDRRASRRFRRAQRQGQHHLRARRHDLRLAAARAECRATGSAAFNTWSTPRATRCTADTPAYYVARRPTQRPVDPAWATALIVHAPHPPHS